MFMDAFLHLPGLRVFPEGSKHVSDHVAQPLRLETVDIAVFQERVQLAYHVRELVRPLVLLQPALDHVRLFRIHA